MPPGQLQGIVFDLDDTKAQGKGADYLRIFLCRLARALRRLSRTPTKASSRRARRGGEKPQDNQQVRQRRRGDQRRQRIIDERVPRKSMLDLSKGEEVSTAAQPVPILVFAYEV